VTVWGPGSVEVSPLRKDFGPRDDAVGLRATRAGSARRGHRFCGDCPIPARFRTSYQDRV